MSARNEGKKAVHDGYMTVEASFVVPWVVFIIVWIMYLGYFEYDRCLLFQDDYSLATQTASRIATTSDKQGWLDAHAAGQMGGKYMGTPGPSTTGTVSGGKVNVKSGLKVSHPLSFHAGMIPVSNWNVSDEVNADDFSYTRRMRLFRAGMRIIGGE